MASLEVNSLSYDSATLYVAGLNTTTTYSQIYISCNGRTSGNLAKSFASSTSDGWYIGGLSGDTFYQATYTLVSSGGSTGGGSGGFTTPTAPSPPSGISYVSVTPSTNVPSLYVAWASATGATSYRVELYIGNTFVNSDGTSGTSYTFTGLQENTTYRVKVYAQNANGNGSPNDYNYATTGDFTPPNISITGISGLGSISASWSANDTGVGLRDDNRFQLYIGSRDGGSGTLTTSGFTNSYSTSWIRDADGKGLVANSYYWIGVRAYDKGDKSAVDTKQVQYKLNRPNNWSWFTSKTSGQAFNVTASEWNAFTERINQFRLFKGYSVYSFTTVESGQRAFAYQINEAIIGMRAMTSVPSEVSIGGIAYASTLNALRDSLNSIT